MWKHLCRPPALGVKGPQQRSKGTNLGGNAATGGLGVKATKEGKAPVYKQGRMNNIDHYRHSVVVPPTHLHALAPVGTPPPKEEAAVAVISGDAVDFDPQARDGPRVDDILGSTNDMHRDVGREDNTLGNT